MADEGATIDQGDKLRDINSLVGGRPPGGEEPKPQGPDDPMPRLLKQIGALVSAKAQTRFKTQEFGGLPWAARSVPNLAGAIADLATGPSVKRRRFDERPANVDSGNLRSSIDFRISGVDEVTIGSNLPYAGDAQFGGPSTIAITATVHKNLATYLARNPDSPLAVLLPLDELKIDRAERIFVGLDDDDRRKIRRLIEDTLSGGGDFSEN